MSTVLQTEGPEAAYDGGRARSAGPPRTAASPREMRLRAIIESAPVSLVVTDSGGTILAANRSALALFDVERLDEVIGQPLPQRVAAEHREAVSALIARVTRGESAALEYELVAGNGRRTVETRAVPLQREGNGPAAFLGATYDVGDRTRAMAAAQESRIAAELASAEREAAETALAEVRRAHAELLLQHRQMEASLQDARRRAEASEAEVMGLQHRLDELQDKHVKLMADLAVERDARRSQTEQLEQDHHRALSVQEAEVRQRDESLWLLRVEYDHLRQSAEAERTDLTARISELQARCARLVEERDMMREGVLGELRAAEARHAQLAAQHERWRAELATAAAAVAPLTHADARSAEALPADLLDTVEPETQELLAAVTHAESTAEAGWEF